MFAEWLFEYQIPAIATIAAAIGGDVTHEPCAVVASGGQQMCGTAAVDADNRRLRRMSSHVLLIRAVCIFHPPIITVKACE